MDASDYAELKRLKEWGKDVAELRRSLSKYQGGEANEYGQSQQKIIKLQAEVEDLQLKNRMMSHTCECSSDEACAHVRRAEKAEAEVASLHSEVERLREEVEDVRVGAFIKGVKKYAWWKDGVQYVGTCGRTLAEAIKEITEGE